MRQLVVENTDKLADLIGRENGKTIADAKGEIGRALEPVEFATNAAQITKGEYSRNVGGGIETFSIRQPVGIVGRLAPLHFPGMVPPMMTSIAIDFLKPVIHYPSALVTGPSGQHANSPL